MEITLTLLLILFAVAMLAGWVDTLAGGGGLLTVPALLLVGVPPVAALATNKSQAILGTFTATATLYSKGHLRERSLIFPIITAGIGAGVGAWLIQRVDTSWLNWVIPLLLLSVALYVWFTPNMGNSEREGKMSEKQWALTCVPAVGVYDGAFGPGTGTFFAASGVAFRGQTLLTATIRAKLFNLTTNVVSLALFAAGGKVIWTIGGAMMVGQMLGAFIGSHTMLAGGTRLIRPLVITMCILMSLGQIAQHLDLIPLP
ncbi:TSUP family transporter [Microbulbifer elongatus]|uniref:Probable membrane transporter protein n=1 Tax=Microbulbifer elongatus TaxID=86173 RepID=A0ABT1P378_9GAMM|nr:TSUP family transporter [Microbulbifer elongatus]MCQ3829454.1 TSUP family transporter [Microbulbifer elongatus]